MSAFSLTKKDLALRAHHVEALRKAAAKLDPAYGDLRTSIEDAVETFNTIIGEYNDALAEAKAFIETVKDDFQSQFDDRSEAWQEGERGEAVSRFIEEWDSLGANMDELEAANIEIGEYYYEPTHADDLENAVTDAE